EDQGLTYWDQKNNNFMNFGPENGLAHSNIHGLLIAGDSLLIGTFFQGLDIIDIRQKKVIKHFDSNNTHQTLKSNFIYHIYKNSNGSIFLLVWLGTCRYFQFYNHFDPYYGLSRVVYFPHII